MKGRGISDLKEFFNSSPSPYPLPSRERGNSLIFSHLPPWGGEWKDRKEIKRKVDFEGIQK
jgi:hypothetical protein